MIIVGVMTWRHFHDTGAECRVYEQAVADDRNLPAGQGQVHELSDQMPVARVFRVDGDCRIAKHGLRSRGGDVQNLFGGRAGHRVLDRPEMSLGLLVVNLVVGHRCSKLSVPVHQALAPEYLAGLEQIEERTANGARTNLIEREAGALPVAGASQQAELAQDPLFVFVLPGPDTIHERRAAEIVAILLLLLQQPLLDDGLGGDSGVVGAWHPEGLVSLHATPSDEDVLDRVVEGMSQVKGAGDIWRWDHNAIRLAATGRIGVEVTLLSSQN